MNAIQSFCEKYNAVPASNSEPVWASAPLTSLLGWFREDVKLLETYASGATHSGANQYATIAVRNRLNSIVAELWSRVAKTYPKLPSLPAGSRDHDDVGRILAALGDAAANLTVAVK